MNRRRSLFTLAALAPLIAAGCMSSTDSGGGNGPTTQSATGVWSGTDSVSGLGLTALINAAGQAMFIRADGMLFTGTVQVDGSNLALSVDGYPDFAQLFSDGSDYGIGTLNGNVTSGSSITATLSFMTSNNTAITGDWSLNYEALSDDGSSTTAISGNFTDHVTATAYSISTTGALSGQNQSNGCTLSGSVSSADSMHDLYEITYTYANCTGTYAALNGVQLSGLATLNSMLSPAQITLALTGATASDHFGLVATLTGS